MKVESQSKLSNELRYIDSLGGKEHFMILEDLLGWLGKLIKVTSQGLVVVPIDNDFHIESEVT